MEFVVDPDVRSVPLAGLPLAIVCVSAIFFVLASISVGVRAYVRVTDHVFGLDDALMLVGTIVYAAVTGLALYACHVGIGTRDVGLNLWLFQESMKFYIIWILVYVFALATVKSSICITIQRIAGTQQSLRAAVWVLLAISWASFLVTFVGTLLYCKPVEAAWSPLLILSGEGYCAPAETLIAIGHVATTTTILTDLALVALPAVILWKTQMKTQAKLQVFGLLSFASIAGVITMVRIPYINHFKTATNLQFWVAHIMLCSNVETGIGCIASSIPTLRRLWIRRNGGSESSPSAPDSGPGSEPSSLFTFGSKKNNARISRDRFRNPTDVGFSLTTMHGKTDGDWERLQDGDSDKGDLLSARGQVRTHHTYTVERD